MNSYSDGVRVSGVIGEFHEFLNSSSSRVDELQVLVDECNSEFYEKYSRFIKD
jgi:hypothetical protein